MSSVPSLPAFSLCLDLVNECLWRGAKAIPLRPKTFAVLRYLVEHAGQLVTKAALLDAVWPKIAIGDGGLMVCMHELRRLLGDDPKAPRFIETVPRRGYRFVGHIAVTHHPPSLLLQALSLSPGAPVGREPELAYLHKRLEQALSGARQVVFATGEAGLGKTTLVDTFAGEISRDRHLWIGRGQCIEHYGVGEAYRPLLEALGRLCRQEGRRDLIDCLARQAPTWLIQMPGLVSATDLEVLQRRVIGATRECMLRELAEAIEVLTDAQPLILVLEDMHWSDYATLDALVVLAQRPEPARLLLIGTYRPEDILRHGHPLQSVQQELQLHGRCTTLPLTLLTEEAVAAYLAARFPGLPLTENFVGFVRERTDGNPLFLVNVVDTWLTQGGVVEQDGRWTMPAGLEILPARIPENLQQMIQQRFDRLSPEEQRVVEAGSVGGVEFSAAAVAAGVEQEVVQVDQCCAHLARRRQLLQRAGETWPDGTVTGGYRFIHALYQEVVYHQVPTAQRLHLHQRLGERLEVGYGAQAGENAAELALHFKRGRDARQAEVYRQHAADNALRRYANLEAIQYLTRGLELLKTLPDTTERAQQELSLLTTLGPVLMAAKGYGAPEVEQTYAQARQLCQRLQESAWLFPVVMGLRRFYTLRAELATAWELGEQLLTLARHLQDAALLLEAHRAQGNTLCFLGEFERPWKHSVHAINLYDRHRHRSHALLYGDDPGVAALSYAALTLWFLGHPDRAVGKMQEALQLGEEVAHPFSMAYALVAAAWLRQYRRETRATEALAQTAMALSTERGFPLRRAQGMILHGWARAAQGHVDEGIAQMQQGLTDLKATGTQLNRPYYPLLLAWAYGESGQTAAGVCVLDEALPIVKHGEERWWEAELHRLKGELLLRQVLVIACQSHSAPPLLAGSTGDATGRLPHLA